jgi:hypothetical protein
MEIGKISLIYQITGILIMYSWYVGIQYVHVMGTELTGFIDMILLSGMMAVRTWKE